MAPVVLQHRQFVCFVCGLPFENYNEYRDHIVTNHEEGREYVLCPLARCAAPVRDVRLHFRVKHPKEALPKTGQMRAVVWNDTKAPKKKKKVGYKEGFHESPKNGGVKLHYRSGYEKSVYECLELWDEVTGFKVESISIEYYFKGKRKRYFPDLLITFKDGHHEVWEIKPKNQKVLEINKAKWVAAEGYCETRKWQFKVIDEDGINSLKQKVRLLLNYKNDNPPESPLLQE